MSQLCHSEINPKFRTIRFKYYGLNTSEWKSLKKLLQGQDKPSRARNDFLERWASKCGLKHLPRCESVIGSSTIVGKDLRLKKSYDVEDVNDIIITNINPGENEDWTTSELGGVIMAFKESVLFYGDVIGVLETHFE